MDLQAELAALDDSALTLPVRQSLGDDSAVVLSWERRPLLGGTGEFVHHVSGWARTGGQVVPWSLVLKLVPGPHEPWGTRAPWWTHEALAYRSGLLARLPGDLVAPRCLGSQDRPDGAVWLWLEEVADDAGGAWPLDRFTLAARHLGAFNAAFPEDAAAARAAGWLRASPPSGVGQDPGALRGYPWLTRGWLREWVERDGWGGGWARVIGDPATWRHPLMRRAYPAPVSDRLLRLHAGRGALLAALERLPHALCHQDAFRRNLLARRLPGGREQTVAIDWPSIGFAALGEEVGKMVATSVLFFDADCDQAGALLAAAVDGYLAGLAERDWVIDGAMVRAVRYAACVSASLHWACTAAAFPYVTLERGGEPGAAWVRRVFGCAPEALARRWAPVAYWLLDLAEEARALGDGL